MSRRRFTFILAAFALFSLIAAGVFVGLVLAAPEKPGSRITPETIAEVRPGMTYDEVVAHFGCPPGHYNTPVRFVSGIMPSVHGRDEHWVGRQAAVYVQFDTPEPGTGRLVEVHPLRHPDANTPSFLGVFIR